MVRRPFIHSHAPAARGGGGGGWKGTLSRAVSNLFSGERRIPCGDNVVEWGRYVPGREHHIPEKDVWKEGKLEITSRQTNNPKTTSRKAPVKNRLPIHAQRTKKKVRPEIKKSLANMIMLKGRPRRQKA